MKINQANDDLTNKEMNDSLPSIEILYQTTLINKEDQLFEKTLGFTTRNLNTIIINMWKRNTRLASEIAIWWGEEREIDLKGLKVILMRLIKEKNTIIEHIKAQDQKANDL